MHCPIQERNYIRVYFLGGGWQGTCKGNRGRQLLNCAMKKRSDLNFGVLGISRQKWLQ